MNGTINELHRIKQLLMDNGYTVLMVGLYGSQNYGLTDGESDVDVRAVVLPTLRDLVTNSKISRTVYYDNGQIDVKDVYTYYNIILKGNPAFTEPVQSKYVIGDWELINMFKQFNDNPMAVYGTMIQKMKRYEKERDPKDASNIIRLRDLFFSEKRIPKYTGVKRKQMMDIKRGKKLIGDNVLYHFIHEVKREVDEVDWGKNSRVDDEIINYIIDKLLEDIKKHEVLSECEHI